MHSIIITVVVVPAAANAAAAATATEGDNVDRIMCATYYSYRKRAVCCVVLCGQQL